MEGTSGPRDLSQVSRGRSATPPLWVPEKVSKFVPRKMPLIWTTVMTSLDALRRRVHHRRREVVQGRVDAGGERRKPPGAAASPVAASLIVLRSADRLARPAISADAFRGTLTHGMGSRTAATPKPLPLLSKQRKSQPPNHISLPIMAQSPWPATVGRPTRLEGCLCHLFLENWWL